MISYLIPICFVIQSGAPASAVGLPAKEALRQASEARYVLSDLSSLSARFEVRTDEGAFTGKVSWNRAEGLKVEMAQNGEAAEDLRNRVLSLLQHRLPNDFESGDGRYNLAWTGDENAIGKQIALNDALQSKYRVRDGAIVEVDRTLGETRLVVNVLEFERVAGGKHLPKTLIVSYFDAASGALKRSETMMDSYRTVDGVIVPASRRVIVVQDGTVRALEILLTEFQIERK
ncbi:MAG: hypothetical protein KatS3mg015_0519 [Fimbriimonadales bacterium]|nr:MAG: hypothetical protein KatS3mg015_0519 [Fimbriimonadales bacterium]